jgi:hypothetical protein
MSPEWVTAAASGATLVVVAITAFAALRQMGHMRAGNQVALFTAYNTEWDSPEFSTAFAFVRRLSAEKIDQETLAAIATGSFPGEYHQIRLIANFFEDIGAFVQAGILPKELVCMLYSQNIKDSWRALSPIVTFTRFARKTPGIWEHFEYLAIVSDDFDAKHPNGIFPHGVRRMAVDDTLVTRYQGYKDR